MRSQVEDVELVELIYAALLGESTWQAFLDRLTRMAPGCWSVLHAHDLGNHEADVGLVSGRSIADVADYSAYYYHISPTGEANVVERQVPGDVLERTEFYTDFLRPIETRSAIGIGVDREGARSLMTPGAAEEDLLPLVRRMTRIAPHLMRAGEFYRRTSFAAQSTELGANFFDALYMGMVVIGNGRRTIFPQQVIAQGTDCLGCPSGMSTPCGGGSGSVCCYHYRSDSYFCCPAGTRCRSSERLCH